MYVQLGNYPCLLLSLQSLPLPSMNWNEVTRSAPISAKPDGIRYPTVPGAFDKAKDLNKYKFLRNNHKACPPDSKRNPGRSGTLIDHVIELGTMYHMLELMDFSTWSMEGVPAVAQLLTKDGIFHNMISVITPRAHAQVRVKQSVCTCMSVVVVVVIVVVGTKITTLGDLAT